MIASWYTHLMHCAAVESEFNAMELILLQGEGFHHFMICAYLLGSHGKVWCEIVMRYHCDNAPAWY